MAAVASYRQWERPKLSLRVKAGGNRKWRHILNLTAVLVTTGSEAYNPWSLVCDTHPVAPS
jgi:hypothetical protein